jgi:hypothetical protein
MASEMPKPAESPPRDMHSGSRLPCTILLFPSVIFRVVGAVSRSGDWKMAIKTFYCVLPAESETPDDFDGHALFQVIFIELGMVPPKSKEPD